MSKSMGNVVNPNEVIKQSGADVLRLWAASTDAKAGDGVTPKICKTSGRSVAKSATPCASYIPCYRISIPKQMRLLMRHGHDRQWVLHRLSL